MDFGDDTDGDFYMATKTNLTPPDRLASERIGTQALKREKRSDGR